MPNRQVPLSSVLFLCALATFSALLLSPALPEIALFFNVSAAESQWAVSLFLLGFAFGQLIYAPLANRFGRKKSAYAGIVLFLLASCLGIFSEYQHSFSLFLFARLLMALGGGVGPIISMTMIADSYPNKQDAARMISYCMIAFAIAPGLAVSVGGVLVDHFGWLSTLYAQIIFALVVILFLLRAPETGVIDHHALHLSSIFSKYAKKIKNLSVISGGLMIGSGTSILYVYAQEAPFIAIQYLGLTAEHFGYYNAIPSLGMLIGALVNSRLAQQYSLNRLLVMALGSVGLALALLIPFLYYSDYLSIYLLVLPMILVQFGLCFIFSNTMAYVLTSVKDRASASAMVSFLNLFVSMVVVFLVTFLPLTPMLILAGSIFLCHLSQWFFFSILRSQHQ